MSERRSVYLVATPLQFLLSVGVASFWDKNKIKYLVISPDFRDVDLFHKALKRWKHQPFSEILLLEGKYGMIQSRFGFFRRVIVTRKNLGMLKVFLKNNLKEGFDFFVSTVDKPEGQLIGLINRKNNGTNYHMGGMGAYLSKYLSEPVYRKLIKKVLYGMWYEDGPSYPEYNYIDKIMMPRPELMVKGATKKETIAIPTNIFTKLSENGLVGEILKEYGIDENDGWDALILAPLSEMNKDFGGTENLVLLFGKIIAALEKKGLKTLVKYHPREEQGNFLKLKESDTLKMAPMAIPSEILCISKNSGKGKIAISDVSTGLFLFKLMNEKAMAISIMGILGYQYAETEEVFLKCGILIPKTIEELEDYL